MSEDQSPIAARKLEEFKLGKLEGRWRSPEIEAFWNHMVHWRVNEYAKLRMMFREYNNEIEEELKRRFAYIDRLIEQTYLDHFTCAWELIPVSDMIRVCDPDGKIHAANCAISEELSANCTCDGWPPARECGDED